MSIKFDALIRRASAVFKIGLLLVSGVFFVFFLNNAVSAPSDEVILLLTSKGESFKETIEGLKDDLGKEVSFIEKTLHNNAEYSQSIEHYLDVIKPKMLVFLGNKPLQEYIRYQKENSSKKFPPAVALSALYLDRQITDLKNINGIRYEIPAVTSLVQLREIVQRPIKKVGIIYREWMTDFIQQNQVYCEQEKIELVKVKIYNRTSLSQLNYHLKHLLHSDIDALWVANDNALLHPRIIQNVWIPLLKQFNKPVIVGIHRLTRKNLNFGTFSVEADHYALGIQAAEMISTIMENDWQVAEHEIEPPLSIRNSLNLKLSRDKKIPIDQQKLGQIDQLIL
ncbi:MAG: hypothetical protein KZQ83_10760 [gamma proteobacterium symbiont of Taylorina sp.]|nr:hypothetical protein [gamma proteobacterium symbiont of Taylorina sp.]